MKENANEIPERWKPSQPAFCITPSPERSPKPVPIVFSPDPPKKKEPEEDLEKVTPVVQQLPNRKVIFVDFQPFSFAHKDSHQGF